MHRWKTLSTLTILGLLSGGASLQAQAPPYYSGQVRWFEVWKNGNSAFTLAIANTPCNGQFLISYSGAEVGSKNAYAALLAAKLSEKPVRVYAGSCVTPPGFGSSYVDVVYLYMD